MLSEVIQPQTRDRSFSMICALQSSNLAVFPPCTHTHTCNIKQQHQTRRETMQPRPIVKTRTKISSHQISAFEFQTFRSADDLSTSDAQADIYLGRYRNLSTRKPYLFFHLPLSRPSFTLTRMCRNPSFLPSGTARPNDSTYHLSHSITPPNKTKQQQKKHP